MRRGIAIVLAGLVLGAVALAIFRTPIAARVMQAALERNMTRDFAGDLPDGLHLLLCGAGGPLPDPQRSGPCAAVVAGERIFVVDVGSGAARNLARMGLVPGDIEALLLTHFHSDHIDGLGELSVLRWTSRSRSTPLPVFGPPGVEPVVEGFELAYRQDVRYRVAHHGEEVTPPSGAGLVAHPFAMPAAGATTPVVEESGLRITAFPVEHPPVAPAVGYRFDYGGRSLVLSGDTRASSEVLRNAEGVDLLVHEALSPELMGIVRSAAEAVGNTGMAKIAADVLDYHASPVEAAHLAQEAGVAHLLFYHVVPAQPLPGLASIFLAGVDEAYEGGVTLGVDGTLVSLPADSEIVRVDER